MEKPMFKEIRGNHVWLLLKRRKEEAEAARRQEETKKSEGRKIGREKCIEQERKTTG